MARKRTKQQAKAWQRRPKGSAQFVQLYADLLDSPAFHDLSPKAKVLYIYCLRESHGAAMRNNAPEGGMGDERLFYMNHALRTKVHELYAPSDTRCFERDMAALIEHGFVDVTRSGYERREKTVYRLSSRWNLWGSPDFTVPENAKSTHIKIQENPASGQDGKVPAGRVSGPE